MSKSHKVCLLSGFVHLAVVSPDEAEICSEQASPSLMVRDRDHELQSGPSTPALSCDSPTVLDALLLKARSKAIEAKAGADRLLRVMSNFEDNFKGQNDGVRQIFQELHESLTRREQDVLSQLESQHVWGRAALSRHRSELQDLVTRLESAESRAKTALEHGDELTLGVLKSELCAKAPPPLPEPSLNFTLPPGLTESLAKIGTISLSFEENCADIVGPMSPFFSFVSNNIDAVPSLEDKNNVNMASPRLEAKTPSSPGMCSPRSPDLARRSSLVAGAFLRSWGSSGNGQGQFLLPYDVTVSNGEVYVADKDNHRIQVFSTEGKFLRKWGTKGAGKGQLHQPWGIAVAEEQVFVSEYSSHRIQVFAPDGSYLREWGSKGSGQGQFLFPQFVTVSEGQVYVADAHRVQVFRLDGTFVRVLAASGPCGVAVLGGEVFVSEYHNHRICVFRADGTPGGGWGSEGRGPGQFKHPYGVAASRTGEVLVADSGNDRVQVFRSDGLFLRELRGGARSLKLSHPQGVAVSPEGEIFVTDWNHRVLVFR